jgi:hypothetical protein
LSDELIVGPKNAAIARGSGTEMVTDSMQTILGRVDAVLGTPGDDAIVTLLSLYDTPYPDDPVSYFRDENLLNTDLAESGNNLSENQRVIACRKQHALRPEWLSILAKYDFDYPG